MIDKLNLGCYKDIRKGYINLDKKQFGNVDIIHNLEKFPYPFKDNTFNKIYMRCVLEHIDNNKTQKVLNELWRISKPKAKIIIIVPFEERWVDYPNHTRGFSFNFFKNNLCSNNRLWLGKFNFKLLSLSHTPTYTGRLIFSDKLRQILSNYIKGLIHEIKAIIIVIK